MNFHLAQGYDPLKLQLLQKRHELQSILQQKAEAVRLQRYHEATNLRDRQQEVKVWLNTQLENLKMEYQNLEFLPKNVLLMVQIDDLLGEFQASDPKLSEKLQTLAQFLKSQQLDARNHDEKQTAIQLSGQLQLVEEALREYKRLKFCYSSESSTNRPN